MLKLDNLTMGFRALGVIPGDVLLVHSSYKSFGRVDGGPQTVIDALLQVLGDDGTLIMPTFNFDFCKGVPWDINTSPSRMGIISELVRKNPESKRVFHPIYSFSVLGKYAHTFASLRYTSSYGKDSAFGKLRDLDGKIMVIGLSHNDSMTFFHHIEELEGVDYRYIKSFSGQVTDNQGNTFDGVFEMLVRDIEKRVETMVDPMGTLLEETGIVKVSRIGKSTVKLMSANEVYKYTAREMKKNPFLLYEVRKPD